MPRALLSIVLATVLALLVWVIATPLGSIDLHAGDMSVEPGSIIPAVVVPGVLAWLLRLAFVSAHRGTRTWTIIAVAVAVLSLLGPLVMGAGGAALVALLAMHVLVGATLVLGLRGPRGPVHASRTTRPAPPAGA